MIKATLEEQCYATKRAWIPGVRPIVCSLTFLKEDLYLLLLLQKIINRNYWDTVYLVDEFPYITVLNV